MLIASLAILAAAAAGFAVAWIVRSEITRRSASINGAPPIRVADERKPSDIGNVRIGRFQISPGKVLAGELRLGGPEALVILRDDDSFHIKRGPNLHLTGILYDQSKITLVDCIQLRSTHYSGNGGLRPCSVELFPHFVLEGRAHIDPDNQVVRETHFTFEDAPTLFYDFDAFGSLIDATPHIAALVEANERQFRRTIRVGPAPLISYFTGRILIVEVPTIIGCIRVHHAPTFSTGGPRGVRIDNQIWVSISPNQPVTFQAAVDAVGSLLRFIAIGVGRAQTLREFCVDIGTPESPEILRVQWSHHPERPAAAGERPPHPADTPLDPIDHAEEFAKVLSTWLSLDEARRVARVRTHGSFIQRNFYSTERMVAVANAFDLLPADAVPKRVGLTDDVLDAKKQSRALFLKLPSSDERESLLRAVGRLGQATLKQKVRHRVNIIAGATGDRFPMLAWLCDQAVECRNHFVHGSPVSFPVDGPSSAIGMLTDVLDFVFHASELIECGWDINRFLSAPTTGSHPFGDFRANYSMNLQRFRDSVVKRTSEDDG